MRSVAAHNINGWGHSWGEKRQREDEEGAQQREGERSRERFRAVETKEKEEVGKTCKTPKWEKKSFFFPSHESEIERQNSSLVSLSLFHYPLPSIMSFGPFSSECYSHSSGTRGSGAAASHSSRIDPAFYSPVCWPALLRRWPVPDAHKPRIPPVTINTIT